MTRQHFDAQIGRLIVLKGWPDDVAEYFTALRDVPDAVFQSACDHALKTRAWFPVPAELRADCDVVAAHVSPPEPVYPQVVELPSARTFEIPNPFDPDRPLKIPITREWRHDCDDCADTGWASRRCPETGCGRRFEHGPHEFVDKCSCREWNPTIRRRNDAQRKYAHAPEKVA